MKRAGGVRACMFFSCAAAVLFFPFARDFTRCLFLKKKVQNRTLMIHIDIERFQRNKVYFLLALL